MKNIEDKLKNFHLDPTGEYVYDGNYIGWKKEVTKEEQGRIKKTTLLLSAIPVILLVLLGCMRGTGMEGNPFMTIPYGGSFIAAFIIFFKAVKFICAEKKGEGRLKEYTYNETVHAIPGFSIFGIITGALSLLGFLLTVSLYEGYGIAAVLYPVFSAATLITDIILRRKSLGIQEKFAKL